jgi:hypothetical protein
MNDAPFPLLGRSAPPIARTITRSPGLTAFLHANCGPPRPQITNRNSTQCVLGEGQKSPNFPGKFFATLPSSGISWPRFLSSRSAAGSSGESDASVIRGLSEQSGAPRPLRGGGRQSQLCECCEGVKVTRGAREERRDIGPPGAPLGRRWACGPPGRGPRAGAPAPQPSGSPSREGPLRQPLSD